MARRKQLKDIAAGIIHSFNSRNNDLEGFWALGKLRRFAIEQDINMVSLDLLKISSSPASNEFDPVLHHYRHKLTALMNKHALPANWLVKAEIQIDFHPEFNHVLHSHRSDWGEPYVCSINICTDLEKKYSVITGGNCRPYQTGTAVCR